MILNPGINLLTMLLLAANSPLVIDVEIVKIEDPLK